MRHIGHHVQLFLVVTSSYSSNGMRLFELATELAGTARRVESVSDIDDRWLEGVTSVGLTSAASTPDDLVQDIVRYFQDRNPALQVIEEGEWEDIAFRPPKRIPAPG